MRRTDSRYCASWMASEHDVVVLPVHRHDDYTARRARVSGHSPTPPLPPVQSLDVSDRIPLYESGASNVPQNIHFSDFWSKMFWSVGGSVSVIAGGRQQM